MTARPIRRNAQTSDRNGKIFYTSTTSLSHISKVAGIVERLINEKEYVEFLIGRDGDFDQIVSSTVRRAKRDYRDDNSELIWVMAYLKAEYSNDSDSFDAYYDRVEVCDEAARSHPKGAIQIRNRSMVDRSDLVVCYVDRQSGGAFQTMEYAKKIGKTVINIADPD